MKILMFLLAIILSSSAYASDVFVRGYYKSNGTYVNPYYRTAPDNTINNNYGTQGNYNPHTGAWGTTPQNPTQPDYTGFGVSQPTNNFSNFGN
jgi:hypothetical protein